CPVLPAAVRLRGPSWPVLQEHRVRSYAWLPGCVHIRLYALPSWRHIPGQLPSGLLPVPFSVAAHRPLWPLERPTFRRLPGQSWPFLSALPVSAWPAGQTVLTACVLSPEAFPV